MNSKHFFIALAWLVFSTQMQAFTISKNTVVTIEKNTQVKLSNLDLHNAGNLFGDTASLLIISSTKEKKISGQDFALYALKIAGDVACEVAKLSIDGDLVMLSGVLNIDENKLIIAGDLLGENENSYVTASSGTIEKEIKQLPAGQTVRALGCEFTPLNSIAGNRIIRSHAPILRSTVSGNCGSANRVYEFEQPLNMTNVTCTVFPHETGHIAKPTLFVESFDGWKKVLDAKENFSNIMRASMFNPDKLFFPKIITPNENTSEVFRITGLEEYPNARLVIFAKNGKTLYDVCPYKNDFDGKNLQNGTYYYMFSETPSSEPIQKSYFEIIRK